MDLLDLPETVLEQIFHYFDWLELNHVIALVCKRFLALSRCFAVVKKVELNGRRRVPDGFWKRYLMIRELILTSPTSVTLRDVLDHSGCFQRLQLTFLHQDKHLALIESRPEILDKLSHFNHFGKFEDMDPSAYVQFLTRMKQLQHLSAYNFAHLDSSTVQALFFGLPNLSSLSLNNWSDITYPDVILKLLPGTLKTLSIYDHRFPKQKCNWALLKRLHQIKDLQIIAKGPDVELVETLESLDGLEKITYFNQNYDSFHFPKGLTSLSISVNCLQEPPSMDERENVVMLSCKQLDSMSRQCPTLSSLTLISSSCYNTTFLDNDHFKAFSCLMDLQISNEIDEEALVKLLSKMPMLKRLTMNYSRSTNVHGCFLLNPDCRLTLTNLSSLMLANNQLRVDAVCLIAKACPQLQQLDITQEKFKFECQCTDLTRLPVLANLWRLKLDFEEAEDYEWTILNHCSAVTILIMRTSDLEGGGQKVVQSKSKILRIMPKLTYFTVQFEGHEVPSKNLAHIRNHLQ